MIRHRVSLIQDLYNVLIFILLIYFPFSPDVPIPLTATCHYIDRNPAYNAKKSTPSGGYLQGDCLFAYSFDNGGIHVYKVGKEDTLIMHDLRQANIFTRLLSGFSFMGR